MQDNYIGKTVKLIPAPNLLTAITIDNRELFYDEYTIQIEKWVELKHCYYGRLITGDRNDGQMVKITKELLDDICSL